MLPTAGRRLVYGTVTHWMEGVSISLRFFCGACEQPEPALPLNLKNGLLRSVWQHFDFQQLFLAPISIKSIYFVKDIVFLLVARSHRSIVLVVATRGLWHSFHIIPEYTENQRRAKELRLHTPRGKTILPNSLYEEPCIHNGSNFLFKNLYCGVSELSQSSGYSPNIEHIF